MTTNARSTATDLPGRCARTDAEISHETAQLNDEDRRRMFPIAYAVGAAVLLCTAVAYLFLGGAVLAWVSGHAPIVAPIGAAFVVFGAAYGLKAWRSRKGRR